MTGERPRLYKIRRLVKAGPREHFQWWAGDGWALDQIDGTGYVSLPQAQRQCESFKGKNRDPDVIYHSVVPV